MRSLFWLYATVISMTILISGGTAIAQPAKEITWLYFNFPTVFIKEEGQVSGFGMETMKLLQSAMPEYVHKNMMASPSRMMAELTEGENVIIVGMLKSPARMKTMGFTQLPCRLTSPSMIAIRKSDKMRLAPNGSVSIEALLKRNDLAFAEIPKVNYGKLQPIIDAHKNKTRSICTSEGIPQLLTMIMNKRVDWTIMDPMAATYYSKQADFNDLIAMVHIQEQPVEFLTGYVVGPKTAWGNDTLLRINEILRKSICSGDLYDIFTPYIPATMNKDFKKAYESLILAPAKTK